MGHYRQWQRLNGKMRFQVSAECCESFARTDVRGETIPDSRLVLPSENLERQMRCYNE